MNRIVFFVSLIVLFATAATAAQSATGATESPKRCYAMNYVLKELDGTKVISQRSYELKTFAVSGTTPPQWTRLRVGNRVPTGTGKDVNYVDIGVNIDNALRESGDLLQLDVTADISSAVPDTGSSMAPPTVRQVKGTAAATIVPGKPAVVFAADDPSSQHRFELQVTATLVR